GSSGRGRARARARPEDPGPGQQGPQEECLAPLPPCLDLPSGAALELGADDLVDVEEAVLLEADLHERGLHAGQHVVDAAEIDVPGDRAPLRPLEVDLADLDRDDQLALRLRQRSAARRLPPAGPLAAAALLPLRERLPLGCLRLPLRGLRLPRRGLRLLVRGLVVDGGGRRARARRLLAPAPAAAAASSLRLGGIGCRVRAVGGSGRRFDYVRL